MRAKDLMQDIRYQALIGIVTQLLGQDGFCSFKTALMLMRQQGYTDPHFEWMFIREYLENVQGIDMVPVKANFFGKAGKLVRAQLLAGKVARVAQSFDCTRQPCGPMVGLVVVTEKSRELARDYLVSKGKLTAGRAKKMIKQAGDWQDRIGPPAQTLDPLRGAWPQLPKPTNGNGNGGPPAITKKPTL